MTACFYVYDLVDSRDDNTFYVGKGKGSRLLAHEAEVRRGLLSEKCNRIREILEDGATVLKRKVAFFENEKEAYAFESRRIAEFGAVLTNGGSVAVDREQLLHLEQELKRQAESKRVRELAKWAKDPHCHRWLREYAKWKAGAVYVMSGDLVGDITKVMFESFIPEWLTAMRSVRSAVDALAAAGIVLEARNGSSA